MDYKTTAKYFKPKKSKKIPIILILIGLPLLFAAGIGIIPIVIGLILLFGGKRPTDQEIDQIATALAGGHEQRALDKLGVDKDQVKVIPPVTFWGWNFGKTPFSDKANNEACDTKGKDFKWRSPVIDITWLFFSEKEMLVYKMTRSLLSDMNQENTESHFYKNMVSVKTESKDEQLFDRRTGQEITGSKIKTEAFMLRNTGGESVYFSVENTILAENTVKAMRNLLREKQA